MKKIGLKLFITIALHVGTSWSARAQGIDYWSSLGSPSLNEPVAVTSSDWYAERFITGPQEDGYYRLNSVRVKTASGSDPEALRITVHCPGSVFYLPGAAVGVLSGPTSVDDNVATYSSDNISLQPFHAYFLVFALDGNANTDSVEVAKAASLFDATTMSLWTVVGSAHSNNGTDWARGGGVHLNMAINATLVPEPSSLALFGLGGLLLLGQRRHGKGVQRPAANPTIGASTNPGIRPCCSKGRFPATEERNQL